MVKKNSPKTGGKNYSAPKKGKKSLGGKKPPKTW